MTDNNRALVLEMLGIIGGFGITAAIFVVLFANHLVYSLLGLLFGLLLAGAMLLYMNHILVICAGLNGKMVEKCVIKHSVIRYIGVAVSFGLICITRVADPITCFVGLLGLKAAAYLQPLLHRAIFRRKTNIRNKEVDI